MEKIVDATYDGEVVRFDEPVDLASNTKVRVLIDQPDEKLKLEFAKKKKGGKPYAFLHYLASLNLDGPSDFSANLDDYLYHGKPFPDEK